MTPPAIDMGFEIAAILLTFVLILRTIPLLKGGKNPMAAASFLFALLSIMLSFVYWLTYTWMRPGLRMPLAANEIGEIAWFLLLTSSLDTVFDKSSISARKETLFALAFSAASIGLWIGWSGEWIQDIVFGVVFGYFLCSCVCAIKQADALNTGQWRFVGLSCAAIILSQSATFAVPENYKQALDFFCYGLMFSFLIWAFAKAVMAVRFNPSPKVALSLAYGACALSFSTLYMSSGWFYLAALSFCLASQPLMLHALERELQP